jgi:hypothetical protein
MRPKTARRFEEMKRVFLTFTGTLLVVLTVISFNMNKQIPTAFQALSAQAATALQDSSACTPPTQMASTPEQTAWQLFVAATCPVNSSKYPYVVWENWIEQSDLYKPPSAKGGVSAAAQHRLHGSPLAAARASRGNARLALGAGVGLPQLANQNCNSKTASGRTICEEVRLNPDAQKYITSTAGGLQMRANQAKLAASAGTIAFTAPSVEIKADWIQYPAATCSNPPQGVHVELIGKYCYALAGMHLISKLAPNWIWATFEPQNLTTNPKRCVELGCNDPFGSNPPYSQGGASGNTQLTPALQQLMTSAHLAQEWFNYRLDGVQMNFVNSGNNQIATATLLGNSIIEGDNVGMPMQQASCITCHSVSSVASNGEDGIGFLGAAFNPVGSAVAPLAKSGSCQWIDRDFVWSLLLAYPTGPSSCGTGATAAHKRR